MALLKTFVLLTTTSAPTIKRIILLFFHDNSFYSNAPPCIVRTWPVVFFFRVVGCLICLHWSWGVSGREIRTGYVGFVVTRDSQNCIFAATLSSYT
jgi:hypothetical protein